MMLTTLLLAKRNLISMMENDEYVKVKDLLKIFPEGSFLQRILEEKVKKLKKYKEFDQYVKEV